eukprot:TRINITY_DN5722_c0_g2_i1.p1 TRINITY_DN5722_c0_g2~~TRINITY_DN5722_c0_g2_i1.p1  ORF type:complete len:1609 (+),score=530.00 TRINITY_DN5722_c0_g2_i1:452-4828(+)
MAEKLALSSHAKSPRSRSNSKARASHLEKTEEVPMLAATCCWLPPPQEEAFGNGLPEPRPLPKSIERLGESCCTSKHVECQLAFLHLSLAVGKTMRGMQHDMENRVAMAQVTLRVVVAALHQKKLKRADTEHICNVVKMYSTVPAFRRGFMEYRGLQLLGGLVQSGKRSVEAMTALIGTYRFVVSLEMKLSGPRAAFWAHAVHNEDPTIADVVVTSLRTRDKDCTFFIEQMALATAAVMLKPSYAGQLKKVAHEAVFYLSGKHTKYISPATHALMMQALCFLLRGAGECDIPMEDLLLMCRTVTIRMNLYSHVLFYVPLLIETVCDHLFTDQSFGTAETSDPLSVLVFETMSGVLMRTSTGMWADLGPMACATGKLVEITLRFTERVRHKGLLRSHALSHLIASLRSPDLPPVMQKTCFDILARVCDQDDFSLTLHSAWGPSVGTPSLLDIKNIVYPSGRLLSLFVRSPHILSKLELVGSIFDFFHAYYDDDGEKAVSVIFDSISVSDFWAWQDLGVHLKKIARMTDAESIREIAKAPRVGERELRKIFAGLKDAVIKPNLCYERWATAQLLRTQNSYANDHNSMYTETVGKGLVFPEGVVWAVLQRPNVLDTLEDLIEEVSGKAKRLHEKLNQHELYSNHLIRYEKAARELQKWYRKRTAVRAIARSVEETATLNKHATSLQCAFRGHLVRKKFEDEQAHARMRRAAALLVQFTYRAYQKNFAANLAMITRFVCEKCDIPIRERVRPDQPLPGQKVRSYIVHLDEWNYFERVLNSNRNARKFSLVYFHHPEVCKQAMRVLEALAITFRDYPDLQIAAINGDENPNLITSLRVPGYPYFIWVDKNNMQHKYTPTWPARPISLKGLVMTHMAVRIQQFWRRRRIRIACAAIVTLLMQKLNWRQRIELRKCCHSGDQAALDTLLKVVPPNELVDTDELPCNIAMKAGHKHVFADLVKAGLNFNVQDRNGHTPVFYAVALGLVGVVRLMVNKGADLTLVDKHGRTLFHIACECKQETLGMLILNLGMDSMAHRRDNNGYTALDYAMSNGLETISLKFLRMGIAIHDDIRRGFIFHCMLTNMIDIANLMISNVATDLDTDDGTEKAWRPIHYAACLGLTTCIERLIDKKVDMAARTAANQSALHLAAKKGHLKCLLMLHEELGLEPEELVTMAPIPGGTQMGDLPDTALGEWVDRYGNTVLHYACTQPPLQGFTETLVKNVDSTKLPGANYAGNTPLHLAAEAGNYFVAYHLAKKVLMLTGLDAPNNSGNTALHLALSRGHMHLAKMLFDFGSDIGVRDQEGNSALQIAVASRHMTNYEKRDVVDFLQNEAKLSVAIENSAGQTALHLLASAGVFEALQLLVVSISTPKQRAAMLNWADSEGNTPLHFACKRGHIEKDRTCENYPFNNAMIIFMIVEGADWKVMNRAGYTPEDLAVTEQVIKRAAELRKERVDQEILDSIQG